MKKKIIISVLVVLIMLIAVIGALFIIKSINKGNKPEEISAKPFVEENNIEVLSAKEEYKVPVEPYAKDANKNIVTIDGINFEMTTASFKFYDYEVSEEDENGYVTHSFKYDAEVPIKYTADLSKTYPSWKYTLALPAVIKFDYNTGEIYKEKNISLDGKLNYYNTDNIGATEDMNYIDVSWNNKTYKIGVRTEGTFKWDGMKEIQRENGIRTCTDTARTTIKVFIYAPKDYDGIMGAIQKSGTSRALMEYEINEYNKFLNEHKDDTSQTEQTQNKKQTLFDSKYNDDVKFTKDDFYVIRFTDIQPKAKE
jgi:hypothetical protein